MCIHSLLTVLGEVCVWSIVSESNQLVAHSGLNHNGHHEPVSKVMWIEDSQSKKTLHNVSAIYHIHRYKIDFHGK